tara:strand:+ start:2065 stop:2247 length:183 start_codon:yes stop_codon:yes gene_type:complete
MSNKYNNVGVYEHTVSFYLNDDDGNELLNDDGSVKIFTAPSLDFTSYAYDMVEVNDLEEL